MSSISEEKKLAVAPAKPAWIYSIVLCSDHREDEKTKEDIVYIGMDLEKTKEVFEKITSADFLEVDEYCPRNKNIIRSPVGGHFFLDGPCNGSPVESALVDDDFRPDGYATFLVEQPLTEEEEKDAERLSVRGWMCTYLYDQSVCTSDDGYFLVDDLILKVAKDLAAGRAEHIPARQNVIRLTVDYVAKMTELDVNSPQLPPIVDTLTELLVVLAEKSAALLQRPYRLVKPEHYRQAIAASPLLTRYFGEEQDKKNAQEN